MRTDRLTPQIVESRAAYFAAKKIITSHGTLVSDQNAEYCILHSLLLYSGYHYGLCPVLASFGKV